MKTVLANQAQGMAKRRLGNRSNRRAPTILACALAMLAPLSLAQTESRFAVKAEVQRIERRSSENGRFSLQDDTKFITTQSSASGRFILKAVNIPSGACAAFPEPIFANGFEI